MSTNIRKRRDHKARHQRAKWIRAAGNSLGVIQTEAVAVEWIKAAEADPNKPKRFTMTAYTGGELRVAGYYLPVVIDLAGLKAAAPLPMLLNHSLEQIVGHADEVDVSASAVKLGGVISGVSGAAAQVLGSAANGFPWKASVGAMPEQIEEVKAGASVKVNGRTFKGPLYVARQATLKETSFCAIGADSKTTVKLAASPAAGTAPEESTMKFQEWIEAMGLVFAELRDDQKAKLQAKYDAEIKAVADNAKAIKAKGETPPPVTVAAPTFDIQAVGLAYAQAETQIEAKAAEYSGKVDAGKLAAIKAEGMKSAIELKSKALKDQWAAPRLEAELLRANARYEIKLMHAERPKGPAIHAAGDPGTDVKILEAAMRMQIGTPEDGLIKAYGEQAVEKAGRFRSISFKELIAACCAMEGRDVPSLGASNREIIASGFSTTSLATLLSNVGHKTMLEAYKAVTSVAAIVARKLTASDFKTHTGVRLTGDFKMQKVAQDGELKHATAGDSSYTYAVDTYGRMFGLTRQMMKNDDLGAFAEIPRMIGRGAALTREELFWTLVHANTGNFFHADNKNYDTSVLGSLGLGAAVALLENQVDQDGNPINIMGKYLVVPPALRVTATELYKSQLLIGVSTAKQASTNIFAGSYEPLVTPYLSNTSFHASATATQWYLFGDPADVPAFGIAYLDGAESPVVEEVDLSGEFLGKAWRGYIDLGVCQIDHRGAVKSAGTG